MNITRRKLIMILALLAAADYGRSAIMMGMGTPPGWKTERWQAGFGSWASGGYGVAYDISMPKEYDFQQKCGSAWVSDDRDESDFSTRLTFRPDSADRQDDFEVYLKEDAGRNYEGGPTAVKMGAKTNVKVGEFRFSRLDFTLDAANAPRCRSDPRRTGPARGFWLEGRQTEHHRRSDGTPKGLRSTSASSDRSGRRGGTASPSCSPEPFRD